MHRYEQSTGRWTHPEHGTFGVFFSGYDDGDGVAEPGEGKNDPSMQAVKSVGPLPRGIYRIGTPFHHQTCGPFSMRLTPEPGTDTLGRSGFLIHGGKKSLGCILAPRVARLAIWGSGDLLVEVVP